MIEHLDPSLRDELLMLAAQIRQFVHEPAKTTWADRRDFVLRTADRLVELAGPAPAEAEAEPERSAA